MQKPFKHAPDSRTAAIVWLLEHGLPHSEVASLTGSETALVEEIDIGEHEDANLLVEHGIPDGTFFKLRQEIRCPAGCGRLIRTVPCVLCTMDDSENA